MEELDTEIKVGELIDTIEYDYPAFRLSMDCFWSEVISGDLVLKEYEAAKWLKREELNSVKWLPAVTEHSYGAGTVYYVAARMESQANRRILELLVSRSGLDLPKLPEGVEYHVREAGGERYIFLLNLEEKEKQIDEINGTDLLTQKLCDGTVKLEPYGVMVVKVKQG